MRIQATPGQEDIKDRRNSQKSSQDSTILNGSPKPDEKSSLVFTDGNTTVTTVQPSVIIIA